MVDITPRMKVEGVVTQTLKATGNTKGAYFVSESVDQLELTYQGVVADHHAGLTRQSGPREPWYKRGIEMRNERQLSVLCEAELREVAVNMALDEIKPEWIGANLMVEGIPDLSLLPARTVLIFEGGVSLRVDGYNGPCRIAGGEIARFTGVDASDRNADYTATDVALAFKDAAHMKRGLVVWVEREGVIRPGESVVGYVWPQWIYGA